MHKAVGQFTRGGKYQQATGVHVQSAYGYPFAVLHFGQLIKHTGTAFRVILADDFAFGFVIDQYLWQFSNKGQAQWTAIQAHHIKLGHALAGGGGRAVDGHAATGN